MNKKAMLDDLFDMLFTIIFCVFILFFLGGFTIHINSNNHFITKNFIERTDKMETLMTRERALLYENQVTNVEELRTEIEGCQSIIIDSERIITDPC